MFKLIFFVSAISASVTFSYGASGLGALPTKKTTEPYGSSEINPLAGVVLLIQDNRFKDAYEMLLKLSINSVNEANRQNLLGFTARKLGDFSSATIHYKNALQIDPYHLNALEYQGKLFLSLGDVDSAKENLRKLKEKCFLVCPQQYQTLKDAIAQF